MSALSTAVCELMGWSDGESLRTRIDRAVAELGRGESLDPGFVRAVAERATVNETYFFRHPEQLAAACAEVLRAFPTGTIRCWSAGCSTGEEPYSLAMQFFLGGLALERLELLGTDVSSAALEQARQARYPEWSFRGVPRAVREQCFTRVSGNGRGVTSFEVEATFRAPVRFASHNFLSPPPLKQAHLVCCRNALIYLQPEAVQRVLRHLESVLVPGGFLVLGAAEQHFATGLGFETVLRDGLVLLRKPAPREETPAAPVVALVPARAQPTFDGPVLDKLGQTGREVPLTPAERLAKAWRALRGGSVEEARASAEEAATKQNPEAHLLLATLDEAAGDVPRALEHLRRALYLDPTLVSAHAAQAALFRRLGRERDSSRARANALRHLEALAPETVLCGIHPLTARELKDALEAS